MGKRDKSRGTQNNVCVQNSLAVCRCVGTDSDCCTQTGLARFPLCAHASLGCTLKEKSGRGAFNSCFSKYITYCVSFIQRSHSFYHVGKLPLSELFVSQGKIKGWARSWKSWLYDVPEKCGE